MLFLFFLSYIECAAYTYRIKHGEKTMCFQEVTKNPNTNILFNFFIEKKANISLTVYGPNKRKIEEIRMKNKGEVNVYAVQEGEYSFCFYHETGSEGLLVDFDIYVKNQMSEKYQSNDNENKNSVLEGVIVRLRKELKSIKRIMNEIKQKDLRNHKHIDSIGQTVFKFSLFEMILIIIIASAQLFVIKKLFVTGKKIRI